MKITVSGIIFRFIFFTACTQKEVQQKPNFIVIFCDDMGYGDLGCYGSELNPTPETDRMAEEGICSTSFIVTSGVCTPSRSRLMTGSLMAGIYHP